MYLLVIINFINMSQRIITSQYFNKMKYIYSSLGPYTKSVILFSGLSFIANNWTLYMYWDYYYMHTLASNAYGNIMNHEAVLLEKAIYTGIGWPFVATDFMSFGNKKHGYYAFHYVTPYCRECMKIINENDERKRIDVEKSIKKYGVWGFYFNKKYVLD